MKYIISLDPEDKITLSMEKLTLRRIVAVQDIVDANGRVIVKKGTKGGFVESEKNLSHEGCCWIADKACVYQNARVSNNAQVYGRARVH